MTEKYPEKIQNLMGVEVCYGAKEYGTIISAQASVCMNHTSWEVITDAGYSFSASELISLITEISHPTEIYEEDNGRYQRLPYVAPNRDAKKFAWGNAAPYAGANISNIANINGEYINIAKRPG